MKRFLLSLLCILACVSLILPSCLAAEATPREQMIDEILQAAHTLYQKANGRLQKASSSGDIYLCKNFTVYVFKQAAPHFAMEGMEDVKLIIPNNLDKKASKPYQYGIEWEDIAQQKGNPFEVAAQFKYDKTKSKQENRDLAAAMLKQVQKGDFFQMSAKYYYGVGAHSLIFSKDYDAEKDILTWTDSNMKGESKNGVRYGLAQWDAEKPVDWFVDAFCQPGRGATLYRLRQDIIKK